MDTNSETNHDFTDLTEIFDEDFLVRSAWNVRLLLEAVMTGNIEFLPVTFQGRSVVVVGSIRPISGDRGAFVPIAMFMDNEISSQIETPEGMSVEGGMARMDGRTGEIDFDPFGKPGMEI